MGFVGFLEQGMLRRQKSKERIARMKGHCIELLGALVCKAYDGDPPPCFGETDDELLEELLDQYAYARRTRPGPSMGRVQIVR